VYQTSDQPTLFAVRRMEQGSRSETAASGSSTSPSRSASTSGRPVTAAPRRRSISSMTPLGGSCEMKQDQQNQGQNQQNQRPNQQNQN
jgi:hypothetical protein